MRKKNEFLLFLLKSSDEKNALSGCSSLVQKIGQRSIVLIQKTTDRIVMITPARSECDKTAALLTTVVVEICIVVVTVAVVVEIRIVVVTVAVVVTIVVVVVVTIVVVVGGTIVVVGGGTIDDVLVVTVNTKILLENERMRGESVDYLSVFQDMIQNHPAHTLAHDDSKNHIQEDCQDCQTPKQ
jgi:hypothetical protein